jgi:hypothetical protein
MNTCPSCGYCPHCGRRNTQPYMPYVGPIWQWYPQTVTMPGGLGAIQGGSMTTPNLSQHVQTFGQNAQGKINA